MNDDARFMSHAIDLAARALAASEFPVGCVIVQDGAVLADGARTGTAGQVPNETDHAEMRALRQLAARGFRAPRGGLTLFCTLEPCLMCFGALLLSGVDRIVYAFEDVMGGGTACDLRALPPLYRETNIQVVAGVLRKESLGLFKAYFENPENSYWRGSLLARYTLEQELPAHQTAG